MNCLTIVIHLYSRTYYKRMSLISCIEEKNKNTLEIKLTALLSANWCVVDSAQLTIDFNLPFILGRYVRKLRSLHIKHKRRLFYYTITRAIIIKLKNHNKKSRSHKNHAIFHKLNQQP